MMTYQQQAALDYSSAHRSNGIHKLAHTPVRHQGKAEDAAPSLSISLNFLEQSEEEGGMKRSNGLSPLHDETRGRPVNYTHSTPSAATFSDSPFLDSPVESEREWRRSLLAHTDPIHKSSHRSASRDPPGSARMASNSAWSNGNGSQVHLFSNASPHIDSSSPTSLGSFADRAEQSGARFQGVDTLNTSQQQQRHHSHPPPPLGRSVSASRLTQQQISAAAHHYSHLQAMPGVNGSPLRKSSDTSAYPSSAFATSPGNQPRLDTRDDQRVLSHMRSFSPQTGTEHSWTTVGSPRLRHGLETMHEETSGATGPLRAGPSRHRATSSVAALQESQWQSLRHQDSADSFARSVSMWKGEVAGGEEASPRIGRPLRTSSMGQQGPSSSSSSSRGEQLLPTLAEPRQDHRRLAGPTLVNTVGRAANDGSDSRRHTVSAAPVNEEVFQNQRRAVGFDMGESTSIPPALHTPGRQGNPVRSDIANSFELFGGGGLAITEDDLALDLDELRFHDPDGFTHNSNGARRLSHTRIPSTHAATAGMHASSMPPGSGFLRQETAFSPQREHWPISARLGHDGAGSTTWNEMLASPPGMQSAFDNGRQQYIPLNAPDREEKKSSLSAVAKAFYGGMAADAHHGGNMMSGSHRFADRQPTMQHTPYDRYTAATSPQQLPINYQSSFAPDTGHRPQQLQSMKAPMSFLPQVHETREHLSEVAIASLVTLGPVAPANNTPNDGSSSSQDLGKGIPLPMLPRSTALYIVEFKEGRTDLYFRQNSHDSSPRKDETVIEKGDLVIVEADRGKDLGTVVNDSITVDQVQNFLSQQADLAAQATSGSDTLHPAAIQLSKLTRSINPKRLFSKAGPADTNLLHSKAQDEERALTLCTTKVNQRGLPMAIVAAEMQWDRKKLTFYYTATQRVDFRDLVKELFRLYKTRIWMCHLTHPSGSGTIVTSTA